MYISLLCWCKNEQSFLLLENLIFSFFLYILYFQIFVEYKKAYSDLKKASSENAKLQKKVNKGLKIYFFQL